MTEGYYDPHPSLLLAQPLVLVGHPGSGVAAVARMISGRTGLPFNDVERAAESMAGASRSRLLLERGLEALRRVEQEALERAVRRRPCGVVAMESGLLESESHRAWLEEQARIVYLRRDVETLLVRIREQLDQTPGSLPEFLAGPPRQASDLQQHLAAREAALSRIETIVDGGDDHPSTIAAQILSALDRLVGVERT